MSSPTPRTVLVHNMEARIHCIGNLHLRITPVIQNVAIGAPVPPDDALLPGVNELDEAEWTKAEQNPIVKHYIKTGVFKVNRQAADITALSPKEALELVKATFDRGLLEKWVEAEKRKPVLDAIGVQLDSIEVPKSSEK